MKSTEKIIYYEDPKTNEETSGKLLFIFRWGFLTINFFFISICRDLDESNILK